MSSPAATLIPDTGLLLGRQLRHLRRMPEKLLGATLMPIAYVLLFGVLFGAAMQAPGGNYQSYLMAGILAQTMLTTISSTAQGTGSDLGNGLMDRFRTLPISPYAVLLGRTVSSMVIAAISMVAMIAVGSLIGWRIETSPLSAFGGLMLLLGFGFAMSWLGTLLGLWLRDAEAINSVAMLVVLPLTFLSNAFLVPSALPGWLQTVCAWNPMTIVVTAVRKLFGNADDPSTAVLAWPVLSAVGMVALMLLILVPSCGRAFRRAVVR